MDKLRFYFYLFICFVYFMYPSDVLAQFSGGKGTSAAPYLIKTADDLNEIRNYLNSSFYYSIENDIDLAEWINANTPETGWQPIGDSSSKFRGYIDGKSHRITGLCVKKSDSYSGFIGYAQIGSIKNLTIIGSVSGTMYVGGLVGYVGSSCTIENCNVKGIVEGTDNSVGGMVGFAESVTITNSHTKGSCFGGMKVGGLVGSAKYLSLLRCSSEMMIEGSTQVGGLIGYKSCHTTNIDNELVSSGKINQCFADCNIICEGNYAGGIVGYDVSSWARWQDSVYKYYCNASYTNCYAKGSIKSNGKYVGGIVGYGKADFQKCYSNCSIKGTNYIGGIAGALNGTYNKEAGWSAYWFTVDAVLNSSVSINTKIEGISSVPSDLYYTCETCKIGSNGTKSGNLSCKSNSIMNISSGVVLQEEDYKGTAVTDNELKQAVTYKNIGWDFNSIWTIDEGKTYPYLRNNEGFPPSAEIERSIAINDNEPLLFNKKKVEVEELTYTRTFNNKDWQPLYVPFEMSYEEWKDDFEVAYVNNFHQYDTDGDDVMDKMQMEIIKVKNGSIYANRPYLIKAKTTGEKTFTFENKALYPSEENSIDCSSATMRYTFTGTYNEIKGLKTKGYYIMSGGSLCTVDNDDVVLKPFRWYMEMKERGSMVNSGTGAMPKIMSIEIVEAEEDDATGIVTAPDAEDAEDNCIYDMSGRKVSDSGVKALPNGMYIKNNKKFIVK